MVLRSLQGINDSLSLGKRITNPSLGAREYQFTGAGNYCVELDDQLFNAKTRWAKYF